MLSATFLFNINARALSKKMEEYIYALIPQNIVSHLYLTKLKGSEYG